MLRLEHLTKTFGKKVAVDDVTFSIAAGEIFSLIGPNSSGKTTIIKTIAGLLHANSGTLEVAHTDAFLRPLEAKAMIGYIPDEPTVWSGMTGEEFLHFVGALYRMNEGARKAKINDLLPIFHLEDIAHDYFENYSRGNKQKFSILAALLHDPKLLLIDEPIVGLDPESAETAKRLFMKFAKEGGAVLLATHTLSVAEAISGRIGVLKNGKLCAVGTLQELCAEAHIAPDAHLNNVYTSLTATV
jgi:ABC-2 type transport system ATP-binding protein